MKHNISILLFVVALLLSFYFLNGVTLWWTLTFELVSFVTIIALGVSFIGFNYFVKSINKGSKKGISFTFDDGPDENITPQILDLLAKENIKATFFIIGNKITTNKALLQRISEEGHIIANHSYSHSKKTTLFSSKKLEEDIAKCSEYIFDVTNKQSLFFRPPFGITTPRYKRALTRLNMQSIGWSIRSLDTIEKNKDVLYKKIISKLTNGSILLFHDTQQVTLEVLPEIIRYCNTNGIKIVPLPDLINQNPYE